MAYLLDTNICIHLRRGSPAVRASFAKRRGPGVVSVISYGELLFGAERSGSPIALAKLEELMKALQIEPLPQEAAHCYGRIRAELAARGQLIGGNDLWIAAHALSRGHTLVTDNEREFSRIDGLSIENWVRETP